MYLYHELKLELKLELKDNYIILFNYYCVDAGIEQDNFFSQYRIIQNFKCFFIIIIVVISNKFR